MFECVCGCGCESNYETYNGADTKGMCSDCQSDSHQNNNDDLRYRKETAEKIAGWAEKFGDRITGQLNVAWFTQQTAEQFAEIVADGGEDETFTEEMFIEYVISNVCDYIADIVEQGGREALAREVFLLDADGQELSEY